ncbi:MAG: DUF2752 domain-containing protein [Polyangiales bacterium]
MSVANEAAPVSTRSNRVRAAVVLAGGLAAFALAYVGIATSGPALCPSRLVFSAPCGTCGMTRAFAGILHGDLAYALRANLGSPLAFAIVLAHGLAYVVQLVTGRAIVSEFWSDARSRKFAGSLILALIVFSFASNLYRHRHGEGPMHLAPWREAAQFRSVTH